MKVLTFSSQVGPTLVESAFVAVDEPTVLQGLFQGVPAGGLGVTEGFLLLMDKILHDPKDPKLWELWYIPYSG